MGVRLRLAATLVAAAALAPACTDGTTPDCSDGAQCTIPSVLSDATDEGDAPGDAQAADAGDAGDAMVSSDARDEAEMDASDGADGTIKDAGHPSDAAGGG
jgi:hypothetical protein